MHTHTMLTIYVQKSHFLASRITSLEPPWGESTTIQPRKHTFHETPHENEISFELFIIEINGALLYPNPAAVYCVAYSNNIFNFCVACHSHELT